MVVRFSEITLLYFSTFLLFAEFCNTCVYNICLSSLNSCCSLSTLPTSWFTMFSVFARRVRLFSHRSIYISGSICASIFLELGLKETSRISRSIRINTKTITPYFIKLATELTARSTYKPQKVTTLRMSQAGVNIQYRKLTIRFSLLLDLRRWLLVFVFLSLSCFKG